MRRTLLVWLLSLGLLLSGCAYLDDPAENAPEQPPQYQAPEEDPEPQGLRTFALPYFRQQTLDPITCPDGPHQTIGALLYEGLYVLDRTFEAQGVLAESFVYDPVERLYGITVREGVAFSDGSPLTAADVAATLRRAQTSPRYGARLAEVTGITAVGNVVYVALDRPNSDFIARLDIPIVKSGTEDSPVPLGTGRYVWQEDDSGAFLAANGHNRRHSALPLERIPLVECKDSDAAAYAFYSREIQLLAADFTGTGVVSVSGGNSYTDAPTAVMQYIGFNTDLPLFADAALRSALSLGIDREGCVNAYLLGHGLAAQFPLSPACALYPLDLARPYSPDAFAEAMDAAGYRSGAERSATMLVSSENSFRVQMAQHIAADLSQYDLQITVLPLPWADFQAALADGNYELYYGECRLTADWDPTALLGPEGALNFSGYTDEELSALLDALAASTAARRGSALRDLCAWLRRQSPIVPVCFKNMSVLLPGDAVDAISPTAADPFYNLSDWVIHWSEDAP